MAKGRAISVGGRRGFNVGSVFFVLGAGIAIIGGILYPGGGNTMLTSVLIAFGVVVGLLNVTRSETNQFLMAAVSLVIITALSGAVLAQVQTIGGYLEGVMLSVMTFVVPAAMIVALKAIYSLAEN